MGVHRFAHKQINLRYLLGQSTSTNSSWAHGSQGSQLQRERERERERERGGERKRQRELLKFQGM